MVTPTYHDRLDAACREKGSRLCVGIDPRVELLPTEFAVASDASLDLQAAKVGEFCRALVELVAPYTAVLKPQSAFFEVFGSAGVAALEGVRDAAREQGLLSIGDLKRGDIGSTAEAYAQAAFRSVGGSPLHDAVTVNPYLGSDGVLPFLEKAAEVGGGVYLLCKTSNPSSAELQDLKVGDRFLHEEVAALIRGWAADFPGSVGAVVGGTHPEVLEGLREQLPGVHILIPGIGAQGAGMADARGGFDEQGGMALVSSSRAITFPWRGDSGGAPDDWREQVKAAARDARDELEAALESSA